MPTETKEAMDVSYYRETLKNQTDQLDAKIVKYNKILDEELDSLPENAVCEIRLAIGKSQLFIKECFKKFSGLIDNCEMKCGKKETKVEDLAGLWDMLSYQINNLKMKFDELERWESNQWKPLEEEKPKPVRKPLQTANGGGLKKVPTTNGKHNDTTDGSKVTKKPAVRSNFREFLKNKAKQQQEQQPKKSDDHGDTDDTSIQFIGIGNGHHKSTNGVSTTNKTTSNDENKCRDDDIQVIIVNHNNNNNDNDSQEDESSKLKNRRLNDVNIPKLPNTTNGVSNNISGVGKNGDGGVEDESEKENQTCRPAAGPVVEN